MTKTAACSRRSRAFRPVRPHTSRLACAGHGDRRGDGSRDGRCGRPVAGAQRRGPAQEVRSSRCTWRDCTCRRRARTPNAILAADAPRELRMQFVRDVGKDKMCEAWDESLKNNTPDADAQLQGEFKELCGWMQDLKKGDVMTFTYAARLRERRWTLPGRRRARSPGSRSPTRCSSRGSAPSPVRVRGSSTRFSGARSDP